MSGVKTKFPIKIGSKIKVWWYTGEDTNNMATILAILPYKTNLPNLPYDCVLRLSAPNCYNKYLDMAYDSSEYERDSNER